MKNRIRKYVLSKCIIFVFIVTLFSLFFYTDVQATTLSVGTLIITSYDTGEYGPAAGESFSLNMTIKVPEACYAVKDAIVQIELPNHLFVQDNITRFYLGDIYSGSQVTLKIDFNLSENYNKTSISIPVHLLGKSDHIPISVEDEIEIGLRPEKSLEVIEFNCPEFINIAWDDTSGDTELIVENSGDLSLDMIYEVVGSDIYITTENEGNEVLDPGEQKTISLKLGAETEGEKEGTLRISYTNSLNQEIVKEIPLAFTAQYTDIVVSHGIEVPEEIIQEENAPSWSVITSCIVGVVSIIVILRYIYRRIK